MEIFFSWKKTTQPQKDFFAGSSIVCFRVVGTNARMKSRTISRMREKRRSDRHEDINRVHAILTFRPVIIQRLRCSERLGTPELSPFSLNDDWTKEQRAFWAIVELEEKNLRSSLKKERKKIDPRSGWNVIEAALKSFVKFNEIRNEIKVSGNAGVFSRISNVPFSSEMRTRLLDYSKYDVTSSERLSRLRLESLTSPIRGCDSEFHADESYKREWARHVSTLDFHLFFNQLICATTMESPSGNRSTKARLFFSTLSNFRSRPDSGSSDVLFIRQSELCSNPLRSTRRFYIQRCTLARVFLRGPLLQNTMWLRPIFKHIIGQYNGHQS